MEQNERRVEKVHERNTSEGSKKYYEGSVESARKFNKESFKKTGRTQGKC